MRNNISQVKLRVAKTTSWQWARASEHLFRFCYSFNYRSTSGMLILKRTTSKWVPLCATMPTSHGTKPTRYLCLEETSAFIVHALWTCYDPCCERQHICVTGDALMPHLHCEYFWSVTCGKPPFPIMSVFTNAIYCSVVNGHQPPTPYKNWL